MTLPPYGICLPCTWVRNRDGDTICVRLRTGQECAVRLIDCWAPERGTPDGERAAAHLNDLMDHNDQPVSLFVPLAKDTDKDGIVSVTELIKSLSFDRLVGRVFIGTEDVSVLMVKAGHATKSR